MDEKIEILLDTPEKAARYINLCGSFSADVDLMIGSSVMVDGKSIVAVFAADLSRPVKTRILTDSVDEKERFKELMKEFQ